MVDSLARSLLCQATPLRPALPEIQTRTISVQLGQDPKAYSALPELCFALFLVGHAPKTCTEIHGVDSLCFLVRVSLL
jgi:hypothetical protein